MLGRNPTTKTLYRVLLIGVLLSVSSAYIAAAPPKSVPAVTDTEEDDSGHGMSAVMLPADARPGDVVELRIEMCRQTWGRFEVGRLEHPQLRTIAVEKIPVSFQGGQYKQRHSLFLQPVSSGVVDIGETGVNISTTNGEETVELPAISLNVIPFDNPALSEVPLAFPAEEAADESSSMLPLLFWIGVSFFVFGIWSLIFVAMRNQQSPSKSSEPSRKESQIQKIIERLQTGVVPEDDLENLLQDSSLSISSQLRSKIEQAVYSAEIEPVVFAELLKKELQA